MKKAERMVHPFRFVDKSRFVFRIVGLLWVSSIRISL